MKVRVADYIASELSKHTAHIFLVTGGGAMHLNDAFGRARGLAIVCCHHEQACSIAAEAYSRVTGKIGAVNVTTGPGGINALNGVFGAWVDSLPMVVVSGQVKRETCLSHHGLIGKLRQLGDQEVDIISMVSGITKYAVLVEDPLKVKYYLEKALYTATEGRPGPVWIDVPIDVQATFIDPTELDGYMPSVSIARSDIKSEMYASVDTALHRLVSAERPVIYAGSGIWHSSTHEDFLKIIERLNVPVVTAWNSNDLIWDDHPLYAGRPGSVGNRAGNFAVQNADCLLVLGCRLNIRLVSYNWKNFARAAYKIGVDIDAEELNKPTASYDQKIAMDLRDFFRIAADILSKKVIRSEKHVWHHKTKDWLTKYPVCLPEYWNNEKAVNPYCFIDVLFDYLGEDDIVVCADGTACVTAFQGAKIKKGQRLFHNSGCASMGYDLPAAIGAAFGQKNRRIICIAGDGSVMMNLQEFQTISGNQLNIKTFILFNEGYHSIRQTQQNYFPDNIVGCGTDSGLSFPDFNKLASAFNLPYNCISHHNQLHDIIKGILKRQGPELCEIILDKEQHFSPKLSSKKLEDGTMISAPLEDMFPFLPAEELKANMMIPIISF